MKGIILAAGKGTRLYPITKAIPKPLVPVYDRPMIYYSIEALIASGIKDIIVVVTEENIELFKRALGDGSDFGAKIKIISQTNIAGTAVALMDASKYVNEEDIVLVYADNILLSQNVSKIIIEGIKNLQEGAASLFVHEVQDPSSFGVVETSGSKVISFEEKPQKPKSNKMALGLYVFPKDYVEKLKKVKKSSRGEYEVASIIGDFLDEGRLKAVDIDDYAAIWYDAGTVDALLEASNTAKDIKERMQ